MLDLQRAPIVLAVIRELGLLTERETTGLGAILDARASLGAALARAETIHVHVRVDDTARLDEGCLRAAGGVIENERGGYVKYAFAGGVNVIFSSIDVAEDDRLPGPPRPRPHLDHLGIDLREESPDVRALFDLAPETARTLGWGQVAQGSPDHAVFCCHTSVAEKHWLYPPSCASFAWPIELAYGELRVHAGEMGCDLRPLDPADARAGQVACCAPTASPVIDLAGATRSRRSATLGTPDEETR